MENAVGFLRRNLMVPPLEAETHTQLGRIMLDRCDALAASSRHYRRGAAIGDVFGEDRAALMPLPSTTFDPIMNICSFQGHCYCRRRPIALFDDYCGSRPPLLRIKATGC